MMKLIGFLLLTAIFVARASAFSRIIEIDSNILDDGTNEIDVIEIDIIKDDEFREYLKNRPEVHVEHLVPSTNVNGIISYTIGARLPGDRLVAHGGQNQSWAQPHNVATTLSYPPSGVGAQVTYVAIQVNQSTNLGQAYILKGGIHQRTISIVVEAYNTLYMNYVAAIYGA